MQDDKQMLCQLKPKKPDENKYSQNPFEGQSQTTGDITLTFINSQQWLQISRQSAQT
jgi:hypothetical protein